MIPSIHGPRETHSHVVVAAADRQVRFGMIMKGLRTRVRPYGACLG